MHPLRSYIRGVRHPEAFHGAGKVTNFFEGWYIKIVNSDESERWAVIPGIFIGLKSAEGQTRSQAFVQVLDGSTGRSWFHEFPIEDFSADTKSFSVSVGDNHFDSNGVTLNLPQLKGRLTYSTPVDPWPVTISSPGIMGWYGLVPFMECFHGIVSMGHKLSGVMSVEGNNRVFDGGRGYIEKDWGKAFPAGYVWMQSNHFTQNADASFVGSVAIIPWLGSAFRGYIIGLRHNGKLHKWTTYNRSKEISLKIDDTHVSWELKGPSGRLEIKAERKAGGLLHAPLRTAMYQRVEETMLSTIHISHFNRNGELIFKDDGSCAAMEVFGDLERLFNTR